VVKPKKPKKDWWTPEAFSDGYERGEGGWDDKGVRSPVTGTKCKEEGCTKLAVGAHGFCGEHLREYVQDSL
jgi:hypothetical protein